MIIGIDLSMTGLGLAAVPADWDLVWTRIATERHSEPLRTSSDAARIDAMRRLADSVERFCDRHRARHVYIEGYPVSGRVFGLPLLCELGGVVRARLAAEGLHAETAPLSSARKLLMGKLPRRDVKAMVHATVRSMGVPAGWSGDEIDAFVAANWGAGERALCCVAAPAAA